MVNQQIVIVGFMGTGKTTVAREVGIKLNCPIVDLDAVITERENRSPAEIIEQDGEEQFRKIETQLLREVLEREPASIIAVGGGAWTLAANRQLIAKRGALSVCLNAPFELCWKRIEAGRESRPLARSRELAEQLYLERQPIYNLADAVVPISESEGSSEIATKLLNAILRLPRRT